MNNYDNWKLDNGDLEGRSRVLKSFTDFRVNWKGVELSVDGALFMEEDYRGVDERLYIDAVFVEDDSAEGWIETFLSRTELIELERKILSTGNRQDIWSFVGL